MSDQNQKLLQEIHDELHKAHELLPESQADKVKRLAKNLYHPWSKEYMPPPSCRYNVPGCICNRITKK